MARRTNHPLKTLFLLGLTALAAWGAYEFIYVRGILKRTPTQIDVQATRDKVRGAILEAFAKDPCLLTVDEVSYRANEEHFRIRVTLSDECSAEAHDTCKQIVETISDQVDETLGVFAYDRAGNLVGKYIE